MLVNKERIFNNFKLGLRDCALYKKALLLCIMVVVILSCLVSMISLSLGFEIKDINIVNKESASFYSVPVGDEYMDKQESEEIIEFIYENGYSSIMSNLEGTSYPIVYILINEDKSKNIEYNTLYLSNTEDEMLYSSQTSYNIKYIDKDFPELATINHIDPIVFISQKDALSYLKVDKLNNEQLVTYKNQDEINIILENFRADDNVNMDEFIASFNNTCTYFGVYERNDLSVMGFLMKYIRMYLLPILFCVVVSFIVLYQAIFKHFLKEYILHLICGANMLDIYLRSSFIILALVGVSACITFILSLYVLMFLSYVWFWLTLYYIVLLLSLWIGLYLVLSRKNLLNQMKGVH